MTGWGSRLQRPSTAACTWDWTNNNAVLACSRMMIIVAVGWWKKVVDEDRLMLA